MNLTVFLLNRAGVAVIRHSLLAAAPIFLLLASLPAGAQETTQPLTITDAGYFLTVLTDDGTPVFSRLTNVIDLRGDAPDTPTNPDAPDLDKALALKVKGWSESVGDPQGAQAIAIVYSHLRGTLGDGTLTETTIWAPLQQATDSALEVIEATGDWGKFREQVTAVITEAKQRGNLQSAQQAARLLLSVQHGLELSADGSEALGLDKLVEIARRTNEAIDDAH